MGKTNREFYVLLCDTHGDTYDCVVDDQGTSPIAALRHGVADLITDMVANSDDEVQMRWASVEPAYHDYGYTTADGEYHKYDREGHEWMLHFPHYWPSETPDYYLRNLLGAASIGVYTKWLDDDVQDDAEHSARIRRVMLVRDKKCIVWDYRGPYETQFSLTGALEALDYGDPKVIAFLSAIKVELPGTVNHGLTFHYLLYTAYGGKGRVARTGRGN